MSASKPVPTGPVPLSPVSSSADGPIILKKYGNRRLYDARRSGYVTLAEVEEMVQRNDDVQVIDAKTGEDLTSQILVQIILDRPGTRQALPTAFLKQVVRLKYSPLKGTFSRGLSQMVEAFAEAQREAVETSKAQLRQVADPKQNPFLAMALNPFSFFSPPAPPRPPPATTESVASLARDREIELLKEQLNETRALVRAIVSQQTSAQPPGAQPQAQHQNGAPAPVARVADEVLFEDSSTLKMNR